MRELSENLHTQLVELLLALADDEFVTGYANSEWTGIAPLLEEDIAFSSLAQDELGHARLFYELLSELQIADCRLQIEPEANLQSTIYNLQSPDAIAYGRAPSGFRNARLVERPRGDWAYSVSRQFLYDTADYVRIESLCRSAYAPLADAAASIIREEKYHLLHAQTWLDRLANGGAAARGRQRAAFEVLWPDALGLFEPVLGENALVAAGILPDSFAALQQRWLSSIAEPLRRLELPFPFVSDERGWEALLAPDYGGRRGEHSESFTALYEQITSVYQLDPNATW
ncbi:MAG TPA: 1,2-phenylacetyl-CoA epoxidase subunit PaaC [Roseiflexaceae bacterium]|nr:1,2-phenylacetyl-CoA epoxidase subunit PaaC [Roseiflexaceae bacterium]